MRKNGPILLLGSCEAKQRFVRVLKRRVEPLNKKKWADSVTRLDPGPT